MNGAIERTEFPERLELSEPFETLSTEQLEYLRQIEELQPENWIRLEMPERLEALQELENRLAELQGRKPFEVHAQAMEPNQYGYYDGRALHLNEGLLTKDNPQEVVETVAHEGRHAYQQFAIEHPRVHDAKEVAYWEANMRDYLDPSLYGFELYQNQPVELDARDYALAVKQGLFS